MNSLRGLIRTRKAYPALRVGEFHPLIIDGQGVSAVVAFLRIHKEQRLAVLVNVGKQPIQGIKLLFSQNKPIQVSRMKTVLAHGKVTIAPATPAAPNVHFVDLGPSSAVVLELMK